jgi:hypothetical protein
MNANKIKQIEMVDHVQNCASMLMLQAFPIREDSRDSRASSAVFGVSAQFSAFEPRE